MTPEEYRKNERTSLEVTLPSGLRPGDIIYVPAEESRAPVIIAFVLFAIIGAGIGLFLGWSMWG